MVPVAPEAWMAWGMMRAAPRLGIALGARLHGKLLGKQAQKQV